MAFIDDGILRVSLTRLLTSAESTTAYNILAAEYFKLHHKVDPTKAIYGHSTAMFLDKQAVNGVLVRNWTKVLGKIVPDVDEPLASFDMKVSGSFATALGMVESGAPIWMASSLACVMSFLQLEATVRGPVMVIDGFALCIITVCP
eukprot:3591874-Amphidinium_carterae.1